MKRILIFLCGLSLPLLLQGENLLSNGGFETPATQKSKRDWQRFPAEGWQIYVRQGSGDSALLTENAFEGKRAVRLISRAPKGMAALSPLRKFPVKPGDRVSARIMFRGEGKAYIRFFWYDAQGKRLKKYAMYGRAAAPAWGVLSTNAEAPEGAAELALSFETLLKDARIDFDAAELTIEPGFILDNGKLRAVVNPRLGGGIDSLRLAGSAFEYTRPNRMGAPGGIFNCIVPAQKTPGISRFAPCECLVLEPGKRIRAVQKWANGLELTRTYALSGSRIGMFLECRNTSSQRQTFSCRIQNFGSSSPGCFSWPTPDWIQFFRQTGAPLNGMNSVVNDLLRAGWQARSYEKSDTTLLYSYDVKKTTRAYNFLTPDFVTFEWYFREQTLAPGESFRTCCSVELLKGGKEVYRDENAIRRNHRLEEIKPVRMPTPPAAEALPALHQETFPCIGSLGNLVQPEMGGLVRGGQYDIYRRTSMRLARVMADGYFTTLGGVHLVQEGAHQKYWNPDGTHEFGEFIRQHHMNWYLSRMMYHRRDTELKAYRTKLQKEIRIWQKPLLQNFVKKYADRMLFINTGDEPLAANIDVVLTAHEELKKWMPPRVPIFTIVNSSSVELMPYMPVYYADFYPIKRKTSSGANPWSVYPEFHDKVRRAGEKPVWFMPQAFMAGDLETDDIYAYPTAGELRLMVHLAAAAGVRGISWFGFPGGGWPWVFKYFYLMMGPLNGSAMPAPGWEGVVDANYAMACAGALLLRAHPVPVPAGCSVDGGSYQDKQGFYNGPRVRLFALKAPEGTVFIAVNQDPDAPATAKFRLPGKPWDLLAMAPLPGGTFSRSLKPGDAAYFYLGAESGIDLAAKTLFFREAARYRIAARRASGNGIPTVDPDSFATLPGRKALQSVRSEQKALEKRIAAAPLGKALGIIRELRVLLGAADFTFIRDRLLLVSPEAGKATPRFRRYAPHPDAAFQKQKEVVIGDFRDVNRLTDLLDSGENAEKLLPELETLAQKVPQDVEILRRSVEKRRPADVPVNDLR